LKECRFHLAEGGKRMPLPSLNKLQSINGNVSEADKIVKDVEAPEEDRDATNKKWVTDNFVSV